MGCYSDPSFTAQNDDADRSPRPWYDTVVLDSVLYRVQSELPISFRWRFVVAAPTPVLEPVPPIRHLYIWRSPCRRLRHLAMQIAA